MRTATAPARGARFGPVIAGAVLTYLGSGAMLLAGLMFLLGTRDGSFLGRPVDEVGLAGASVPIGSVRVVGLVLTVVGVALVALATLVLRRKNGARVVLTCLGGLSVGALLYAMTTGDVVSPLPPMVWIAVAVLLLWLGGRRL